MALLESQLMKKGELLPPFQLKNFDGTLITSQDFFTRKLLLIVFTCNHCPYAKVSWPILVELQKKYESNGLQVIGINSNNNPSYPEDRFEKMKEYVEKNNIHFPYLFDESQDVAKKYQAVCTPDPFLFRFEADNFMLYYHGRLNDNWQDFANVKEKSMELFIKGALGIEKTVPEKVYPSMGCSIKWVD